MPAALLWMKGFIPAMFPHCVPLVISVALRGYEPALDAARVLVVCVAASDTAATASAHTTASFLVRVTMIHLPIVSWSRPSSRRWPLRASARRLFRRAGKYVAAGRLHGPIGAGRGDASGGGAARHDAVQCEGLTAQHEVSTLDRDAHQDPVLDRANELEAPGGGLDRGD